MLCIGRISSYLAGVWELLLSMSRGGQFDFEWLGRRCKDHCIHLGYPIEADIDISYNVSISPFP